MKFFTSYHGDTSRACLASKKCFHSRSSLIDGKFSCGSLLSRRFSSRRFPSRLQAATRNRVELDSSEDFVLSNGMIDYYAVLGIDDNASDVEIKSAYRALAKVCHPDISGDERGHNMCILLNEAYTILSDPSQRIEYNQSLDEALEDEEDGYTGLLLSKWLVGTKMGKNTDPNENRAVFVDEISCIGCKQCVYIAPATFRIEDDYGRSRVFAQWVDKEDDIEASMLACPVSCIYWVEKQDLPALEHVTQYLVPRVNVGAMMSGQGGGTTDVWQATAKFLKDREERKKERERAARVSKAQAAARATAAADIQKKQEGWFDFADKIGFGDAASKIYASMESNMSGSYSSGSSSGEYDDDAKDEGTLYSGAYKRVGKRRRKKNRTVNDNYGGRGENGGRVPSDRALVPAAKVNERKVWQRY